MTTRYAKYLVATALFVVPAVALADSASDNSQAIDAEANQALMTAGQQANAALEGLIAARGAVALPNTALPTPQIPLARVPDELKQPITMSWNGRGDELAQKIAQAIGYKFSIQGPKPSVPTLVTMVFQQEPAIWALQRLGVRIRETATVSVNAAAHEVDFTFLPSNQIGPTQ